MPRHRSWCEATRTRPRWTGLLVDLWTAWQAAKARPRLRRSSCAGLPRHARSRVRLRSRRCACGESRPAPAQRQVPGLVAGWRRASTAIRTGRSRTSSGYVFSAVMLFIVPWNQSPPAGPERFSPRACSMADAGATIRKIDRLYRTGTSPRVIDPAIWAGCGTGRWPPNLDFAPIWEPSEAD